MEVITPDTSWGLPSDTSTAVDALAVQTQVVTATIAICSGVSISRCPSDIVSRQTLITESYNQQWPAPYFVYNYKII